MTDHIGKKESEMLCTCGEKHTGHICWLSKMGLIMEIQHLSDAPTVTCSNCGARANLAHNVCFPISLNKETR